MRISFADPLYPEIWCSKLEVAFQQRSSQSGIQKKDFCFVHPNVVVLFCVGFFFFGSK